MKFPSAIARAYRRLTGSEARSGFTYTVELIDPRGNLVSREVVHNLVPIEGLNHIAGVVFKGVTPVTAWYLGLYKGNYTPSADETAATVAAATTETTSYDEPARVLFNSGAVAAGALNNFANVAEFTFNATETIYGGFVVSSSAKASGTGVLVSLVRFPSPKVTEPGSVLRVKTGVAFLSA